MGNLITHRSTPIAGVSVLESEIFQDHRGAFVRLFCMQELEAMMGHRCIMQSNFSRTAARGAIRGLHFQFPPYEEMKVVRCLKGRVFDVVVDLRAGSPTFLKWHAEELTPENRRAVVVAEGCAHGFQVIEPDSELLYFHTSVYRRDAEGGVRFDDPALGITWPLPVSDLSERDRCHALLTNDFTGL